MGNSVEFVKDITDIIVNKKSIDIDYNKVYTIDEIKMFVENYGQQFTDQISYNYTQPLKVYICDDIENSQEYYVAEIQLKCYTSMTVIEEGVYLHTNIVKYNKQQPNCKKYIITNFQEKNRTHNNRLRTPTKGLLQNVYHERQKVFNDLITTLERQNNETIDNYNIMYNMQILSIL